MRNSICKTLYAFLSREGKILALVLILFLLACGSTTVTIRVDIMSFLDDEHLRIAYGDNPVIPGNGPEVSIRTPVETIPLPDELNTITEIEALEINAVVDFHNETGTLDMIYRIYFDSSPDDIFSTPPVLSQNIHLDPGATERQTILIEGDRRVLDLFENDEISTASEIHIIPGGTPEFIRGEVETVELTVLISAAGEN